MPATTRHSFRNRRIPICFFLTKVKIAIVFSCRSCLGVGFLDSGDNSHPPERFPGHRRGQPGRGRESDLGSEGQSRREGPAEAPKVALHTWDHAAYLHFQLATEVIGTFIPSRSKKPDKAEEERERMAKKLAEQRAKIEGMPTTAKVTVMLTF